MGQMAQGQWLVLQRGTMSNVLKLRAAYQALLAFQHLIRKNSVLMWPDNTTAVAYIRRQGGTRSRFLLEEVTAILSLAENICPRDITRADRLPFMQSG